ncbi:unnamed protein product [Rotaria sp. Silwood1]|nr:unnamed protein product [Rotaria sp. Silwood1]
MMEHVFYLIYIIQKQPNRTHRPRAQSLHECFLKEVYTRLSSLLIYAIPPSTSLTSTMEAYYKSLQSYGEQLITMDSSTILNESSINIDHQLWLQNIERLFMITEEYIHIVEHEHSPTAHITPFHDFIEHEGVEFLFKLLQSLNYFINDDYQYSLCQEITILILQLIQLLLCGNNQQDDIILSRPTSPIAVTANDNVLDTIDFDFQATIEHLQFDEFVGQIKQLIFLCWAAAAGNIRLQEQILTIKEQVKLDRYTLLQQINGNVFCRNSSKNSTSSDSSINTNNNTNNNNNNIQNTVQFGICVKKDSILPLDSEIAEKIIDIVMFCFEKRPEFIATFLIQPFFADFLLEILISTSSREVRQCALRNIIRLCKIETSACDIRAVIHQILLKARLPLWPSSATTRSANQKLLSQSIEYFDLRCQLTENLTKQMQIILNIDAKQILTNEFNWLSSYTVSTTSNELRTIDNILFIGHLRFIRTLLTCETINKIEFGIDFIRLIIDQFLFPASKRMSCPIVSTNNDNDSLDDSVPEPKCSTSESRLAAYDVLVELVRNCRTNLKIVVDDLINLHHRPILEKQTEWEFMPQVNPRAPCGLVGLYNVYAISYRWWKISKIFSHLTGS